MARKLVVVHDNVRLAELGNIYGPISTPTRIPLESIRAMCVKNRDVWECDPADPRNREKRVKLTLANYGETNFGIGKKNEGAETYSYTKDNVPKDAMSQLEPAHTSVAEKKDVVEPAAPVAKKEEAPAVVTEPETPVAAPVDEKQEEAPATEPAPAETPTPEKAVDAPVDDTAEEAAPVEENVTANQQNNPQIYGEKKHKKGR